MQDFRSFAQLLEQRGDLVRVREPVDPRHELPAVMARLEAMGKAFIFENVKGADYPLIGGLFNRVSRFGLALGEPAEKPFDHADMDAAIERAKARPIAPREVKQAPVQAVVKTGDDIDLGKLPVPTFFELDSGPFITAAVGISRNPRTGLLNAGFYRTLILDKRHLAINASSLSDLRRFYQHAEENGTEMPIALAIGVEPALLFAAACKLPPTSSELDLAGAFRGAGLEVVRARNSDLLVPANAEMILEGRVDFSRKIENTLGEFAGQYGPETAPVTEIVTITQRKDPLFYSIMAGRNPEHNTIGSLATYGIQRDVANSLKKQFPEVTKIHVFVNPRLGPMVHVVMAIRKKSDEQPKELIRNAFKASGSIFPVSMIAKRIIVVDEDIDIDDLADVEWAIWTRVADASKYLVIPDVKSWELDRAAKEGRGSLRIGIDATMDMEDRQKLVRPSIPGAERIDINRYLSPETRKRPAA